MSISQRPGTVFGPSPPLIRVTQRVAGPSRGCGATSGSAEAMWSITRDIRVTALTASSGRELCPALPSARTV